MLIPASKRADIANAVNAANEAKKDREIMEAASYAIPRAREIFEEGIEKSALNGCNSLTRCLGHETDYGCVKLALEEKYGCEYPGKYNWGTWLRGDSIDSKRGHFVYETWARMVEHFLSDLRDNGYEAECKSKYIRYETTAENLADHKLKVSW